MPKVFHKHIKYAKNPAASLAQKHWEIITHVKQNKHTILHTHRYTYVCVCVRLPYHSDKIVSFNVLLISGVAKS